MRKRKLKPFVVPTLAIIGILGVIFGTNIIDSNLSKEKENEIDYVTKSTLENQIPVIKTTNKIINPYTDQSVTIGKYYYDYKSDAPSQEKSIVYHNDTYIQNSGIDFVSENEFDVVSVLDGTVADVKDDETLGKIVEVKHENGYISIYQSLSSISVKKGDIITQGQTLGKSGTNELDKEMGNHLHFEFYANGQTVNPSLYLDKEIKDNKEQE